MIFSSTNNMSALSMAVLLMPLSWPFVLSFSCRLATWMYRLFLVCLAALLLSATCLSTRQHDIVPDLCRYAVPPELDGDLFESGRLPGAVAESQAFVFASTEHVSVADAAARLKKESSGSTSEFEGCCSPRPLASADT